MQRSTPALAVAAFLAAAASAGAQGLSPAEAELQDLPDTKVVFYDVTGRNHREIRQDMDRKRPAAKAEGAKRHDAYTAWTYRVGWPRRSDGACDLAVARVEMEITVTMPRLIPHPRADRDLLRDWAEYERGLAIHERGHAILALTQADRVRTALKSSTCDTAQETYRRLFDELKAANEDYDRRTEHGARQGAVFG